MTDRKTLIHKYDNALKMLFSHTYILAPILKMVIPEYKDYDVEEIEKMIVTENTEPDQKRTERRAVLFHQEENDPEMKNTIFDLVFRAENPKYIGRQIEMYLLFDLELQGTLNTLPYPLQYRQEVYVANAVTRQFRGNLKTRDYAHIQKAYSLWIVYGGIPKEQRGTVTKYPRTKVDLIGHMEQKEEEYNLSEIITIRLGEENSKEAILEYLGGLFSRDVEKVMKYANIKDEEGLRREVHRMNDYFNEIIEEKKPGWIAEGEAKGEAKGKQKLLLALLKAGRITLQDAEEFSGISPEDLQAYLKKVN